MAAPACLSGGDPPLGLQVSTDRTAQLMGVLPVRTPDDGVVRTLAVQRQPGDASQKLYAIVTPRSGGPSREVLLTERFTCNIGPSCVDVDDQGRAFVWSVGSRSAEGGPNTLARIDLDTGERVDFGPRSRYAFSASRRRAIVSMEWGNGESTLVEGDGSMVALPMGGHSFTFIGEDLVFVDQAHVLTRMAVGRAPEALKEGILDASPVPVADGAATVRLLLVHVSPGLSVASALGLLDPATGVELPLPPDARQRPIFSGDGRWALVHEGDPSSNRQWRMVDVATGAEEPFELPVTPVEPSWRPYRTEAWFVSSDWTDRRSYIKRPGQPLEELPAEIVPWATQQGSLFTSDGERLFSGRPDQTFFKATVFVGRADDLAGPRFPLNPTGSTYTRHQELPDGRLVVEAFHTGGDRSDMYLVDPADGATRLLGKLGSVAEMGAEHLLLFTHRLGGMGDLVAVDVDGSRSTTLGTEFVSAAYAQPSAAGAVASFGPGVPVAFQFRARFASPYDGLWLAIAP